jgi:lysophospholipase L1-like esterase
MFSTENKVKDQLVKIIYSGLYNPFADSSKSRLFNSYLTTWNGSVSEMLESDDQAVVVPTADIFKLRLYEYLSPDQFHPNRAGYDAIADRVTSLLK